MLVVVKLPCILHRVRYRGAEFKRRFKRPFISASTSVVPAPMAWVPVHRLEPVVLRTLHIQGTEGNPVLHASEDDDDALVQVGSESHVIDLEVRSDKGIGTLNLPTPH